MSTSVVFRVPQEQSADSPPSRSAPDIYGRAVLRVVDTVCREQVDHAKFVAQRPKVMSLDNSKLRAFLGEAMGSVGDFLQTLRAQELAGRSHELCKAVTRKKDESK